MLAIDLDHQGNFTSPVMRSNRATTAGLTADRIPTEAVSVMPSAPFVMVPSDAALLMLERQPTMHKLFVHNLCNFLTAIDAHFDVCVIDINPNPGIRVISALG